MLSCVKTCSPCVPSLSKIMNAKVKPLVVLGICSDTLGSPPTEWVGRRGVWEGRELEQALNGRGGWGL